MSNITEAPVYDAGIYQLELSDDVIGGPGGIANAQAVGLANRTNYLKARLEAIAGIQPGDVVTTAVASLFRTGYLLCDGSPVSRATYAALFAAIGTVYGAGNGSTTFNLPDHRDNFLRVWNGGGTGNDTGRSFGTQQLDQFQGHTFGLADGKKLDTTSVADNGSPNQTVSGTKKTEFRTAGVSNERAAIVADDLGDGTPRIGTETRPRNVGVNTFIKY